MADSLETDEQPQVWRPPRGPLFKLIAWVLLVMIVVGVGAMIFYVL